MAATESTASAQSSLTRRERVAMVFWLNYAAFCVKEDPASAVPFISNCIQTHPRQPVLWHAAAFRLLAIANQRCGELKAGQQAAQEALNLCLHSHTGLGKRIVREMTSLLQMSPGMSLKQPSRRRCSPIAVEGQRGWSISTESVSDVAVGGQAMSNEHAQAPATSERKSTYWFSRDVDSRLIQLPHQVFQLRQFTFHIQATIEPSEAVDGQCSLDPLGSLALTVPSRMCIFPPSLSRARSHGR